MTIRLALAIADDCFNGNWHCYSRTQLVAALHALDCSPRYTSSRRYMSAADVLNIGIRSLDEN